MLLYLWKILTNTLPLRSFEVHLRSIWSFFFLFKLDALQNNLFWLIIKYPPQLVALSRICLQCRRPRFNPWVGKILWRWEWQSTPVFLPRIPWTEKPGEIHSMGLQRVRHYCVTNTFMFLFFFCFSNLFCSTQENRWSSNINASRGSLHILSGSVESTILYTYDGCVCLTHCKREIYRFDFFSTPPPHPTVYTHEKPCIEVRDGRVWNRIKLGGLKMLQHVFQRNLMGFSHFSLWNAFIPLISKD